jgi:hypothetical protein
VERARVARYQGFKLGRGCIVPPKARVPKKRGCIVQKIASPGALLEAHVAVHNACRVRAPRGEADLGAKGAWGANVQGGGVQRSHVRLGDSSCLRLSN